MSNYVFGRVSVLTLTNRLLDVPAKLGAVALRMNEWAMRRQLLKELDDGTFDLLGTQMGLDEEGCVCRSDDCFARWYHREGGGETPFPYGNPWGDASEQGEAA